MVTGRNSFFTMTPGEADLRGLVEHCVPLVARSAQLEGVRFAPDDLAKLVADDARCRLPALGSSDVSALGSGLAHYIEEGEHAGVHKGYQCSIRRQWWSVPSVWVPDGFMLRQIHTHPRVFANEAGAVSTDTIHRMRIVGDATGEQIAAGSVNSLTFASAEILGRSYGGGILELEPNEAEALLVPPLTVVDGATITAVDKALRLGEVTAALDLVDHVLLVEHLGWPLDRVHAVRAMWERLRDRRLHRGVKAPRTG